MGLIVISTLIFSLSRTRCIPAEDRITPTFIALKAKRKKGICNRITFLEKVYVENGGMSM
jgi:hypothetical protein